MVAQESPKVKLVGASQTKAAKTTAEAFDAHYRGLRSIAGYFLEKYTSGGSSLVAESGTVYFEKPGRMRWDYDAPEKKMFLVDGKNVWYYVPMDHTASRTSIKESADWRTPLALLAGKVDLERLCGALEVADPTTRDTDEKNDSAGDTVLICRPRKTDENAFTKVTIEVNVEDQLVRLGIEQPGDIQTEFRFGDWHENAPIEESKFHFEPPPGVAIVDDAALANKVQ